MMCLSLWQPWATLMAILVKAYETRSWSTKHRGLVAIHAASIWTRAIWAIAMSKPFSDVLRAVGLDPLKLPRGKIVAVGELVDVIRITPEFAASLSEHERAFGDYTPGRFAWKFQNVRRLDDPIPFRAYQGLFNLKDPAILAAISSQLEAAA